MVPIGRGQWELIVGDRQTRKTLTGLNNQSFNSVKEATWATLAILIFIYINNN